MRPRCLLTSLLPLLLVPGCASTTPDFARPRVGLVEASRIDRSDLIGYRTLTREDFRGADPPGAFAPHRDRLGAATCGYIMITPETGIEVRAVRSANGVTYETRPHGLRFRALMDRKCSWWNSTQRRLPPQYVLEHEQIHFALFEIEARKLDARAAEITRESTATASDRSAAADRTQKLLEQVVSDTLQVVLRRSREFDDDTSMGYEPERQQRWLRRVTSELNGSSL